MVDEVPQKVDEPKCTKCSDGVKKMPELNCQKSTKVVYYKDDCSYCRFPVTVRNSSNCNKDGK
jgi:hypothetical protein